MNLSAWVLSIVGIVVLTLMVDIIIPEGKTGKYIKGVCNAHGFCNCHAVAQNFQFGV